MDEVIRELQRKFQRHKCTRNLPDEVKSVCREERLPNYAKSIFKKRQCSIDNMSCSSITSCSSASSSGYQSDNSANLETSFEDCEEDQGVISKVAQVEKKLEVLHLSRPKRQSRLVIPSRKYKRFNNIPTARESSESLRQSEAGHKEQTSFDLDQDHDCSSSDWIEWSDLINDDSQTLDSFKVNSVSLSIPDCNSSYTGYDSDATVTCDSWDKRSIGPNCAVHSPRNVVLRTPGKRPQDCRSDISKEDISVAFEKLCLFPDEESDVTDGSQSSWVSGQYEEKSTTELTIVPTRISPVENSLSTKTGQPMGKSVECKISYSRRIKQKTVEGDETEITGKSALKNSLSRKKSNIPTGKPKGTAEERHLSNSNRSRRNRVECHERSITEQSQVKNSSSNKMSDIPTGKPKGTADERQPSDSQRSRKNNIGGEVAIAGKSPGKNRLSRYKSNILTGKSKETVDELSNSQQGRKNKGESDYIPFLQISMPHRWLGRGYQNRPVELTEYRGHMVWVQPKGTLDVIIRYGNTGKQFSCLLDPQTTGMKLSFLKQNGEMELVLDGSENPKYSNSPRRVPSPFGLPENYFRFESHNGNVRFHLVPLAESKWDFFKLNYILT